MVKKSSSSSWKVTISFSSSSLYITHPCNRITKALKLKEDNNSWDVMHHTKGSPVSHTKGIQAESRCLLSPTQSYQHCVWQPKSFLGIPYPESHAVGPMGLCVCVCVCFNANLSFQSKSLIWNLKEF